jgi:hypothetical protein
LYTKSTNISSTYDLSFCDIDEEITDIKIL